MTTKHRTKDNIYSEPLEQIVDFEFDANVVSVFSDMINRSVPGYAQIIQLLSTITKQFIQPKHNYYDLGCSLGASMLAMGQSLNLQQVTIIGVDNSPEMIKQAQLNCQRCSTDVHYQLVCDDIANTKIDHAAMVVMNFTLQFILVEQREKLIKSIYDGLITGGAFVLSEKIYLEDNNSQQLLTELHHQYKADQGYSDIEISQKRDALENVLIPETLQTHTKRLKDAGFSTVTPWMQNFQFVSLIAVK